jgi:PAS domain S-box-containing protein
LHLLEHAGVAIVVANAASKILWANAEYCAITGYRLEELVGRTPALLRGPDTSLIAIRELWDELGSVGRSEARFYNRRADGSLFKAAVTLVKVQRSDPEGAAIICTMRDVTAESGMEERLAFLAQQANAARDTTILALASLAEQRDPATGAHLQRIEEYSRLLAEWLAANRPAELPEHARDPETIGRCAMLHDIGKVGIPDSVLLKSGLLEDADREVMQQHPRLGAEILDRVLVYQPGSAFLRIAREIIAYHHEAYDGSGYPYGLAGSQVPLVAQIATVADVFDALTSARPYKPAHSTRDALTWICDRAGKQFAPLAVDALRAQAEAVAAVRERLGDAATEAPVRESSMRRTKRSEPPVPGRAGGPLELARVLREAFASRTGGEVLVRSGDLVGRVHVCEGRIAWATLSSQPTVLADRLVEVGFTTSEIELAAQECKRSGRNLGESLVARGLISADEFRRILRDHVSARLAAIRSLPEPIAMFAPRPHPYSAQFTFEPAEVLGDDP